MLFVIFALGLLIPLKVNALSRDRDLAQFSFRVNRVGTVDNSKYFIDFFMDTGDVSMPVGYISWKFRFVSALDLINTSISSECDKINNSGVENMDNIISSWFSADCSKKGGKVRVMSFELKPNISDKIDHLFYFDPSGVDSTYQGEWVSGSSNFMILSNFPFGSGCSDAKKMGDYNNDGNINGLDYTWWKQEFVDKIQHEGKWEATPDCSDKVTSLGYSVWRYNYLR